MTKEEARNNMVDYYTNYLTVAQGLVRVGEAKDLNLTPQALTGLFEGIRKVSHYQQRLLEQLLVQGAGRDVVAVYDNLLNNACKMAQIGMCYYNIYCDNATPENEDVKKMYNLIANFSLKSTHQAFPQEFIDQYTPKI